MEKNYNNEKNEIKRKKLHEFGADTAKSGILLTFGEIISSILTLLLLIFLARLLQPTDFGIYSIAIAFAAFLGLAGNFGIGTAFRKIIPQIEKDKSKIGAVLTNGYFISLTLSLILLIIGAFSSNFIATTIYKNENLIDFLILASFIQFFTVLFNLSKAALTSFNRIKEVIIGDILYSGSQLLLVIILVLMGFGIIGALVGFIISLILASALYLFWLFSKIKINISGINKKEVSELTKFSAPVIASNLAISGIQNFSILLLGVFSLPILLGNYSAAYRLSRLIEIIIQALSFILLGAFSKAVVNKNFTNKVNSIYNGSIYYTFLIILPLIIYIISVISPLVTILISKVYLYAPLYALIMMIGMTLEVISIYAGNLLLSYGHSKSFMKYQLLFAAIQFILLVALVPLFSTMGAIIALFVIAPIIGDLIYIFALKKKLNIEHRFAKIFKMTTASVLTLIILEFVTIILNNSKFTILTNLAILIIIYPPIVVLCKGVNKKDIEFLKVIGDKIKILKPVINYFMIYFEIFLR